MRDQWEIGELGERLVGDWRGWWEIGELDDGR